MRQEAIQYVQTEMRLGKYYPVLRGQYGAFPQNPRITGYLPFYGSSNNTAKHILDKGFIPS